MIPIDVLIQTFNDTKELVTARPLATHTINDEKPMKYRKRDLILLDSLNEKYKEIDF